MRKTLLAALFIASCGAAAPAMAQTAISADNPAYAESLVQARENAPTQESIARAERIMATVEPEVFTCKTENGSTYTQYRFYTSDTSYLSNYEAGTVSCEKLKR